MTPTAKVEVDDRELVKMIKRLEGKGKVVRILADGVDYGVHQEFGTSRMAGKPFMTPAIEHVRPALGNEAMKQIVERGVDPEDYMDKVASDALAVAIREAPVDTGQLRASLHIAKGEDFIAEYETLQHGERTT